MSKRKPYRFLIYIFLEIGRRIIPVLPRRLCYGIAGAIGIFVYRVLPKERNKTIRHLTMAFGTEKSREELEQIASRVFVNLAKAAVDVFQFPKLNLERLDQLVVCPGGFRNFNEVFTRKKGMIGLTAHLGNWELLAAYFKMKGYEGRVVGRRIYYEPFNRVLIGLRRSVGLLTIYRDGGIRDILRELRQNHWIGLLPDQDMDSLQGIFVPFFGQDAWTPTGPAQIAIATGASIVPVFVIRENDRYRLDIEDSIDPNSPEFLNAPDRVRALTLKWTQIVEQYVRRYPDQWVWMHHRWKTRPDMMNQKEQTKEL